MIFSDVHLQQLFPTPVIHALLPPQDSERIRTNLLPIILKKAGSEKSAAITNIGGWQSDTRILEWGGDEVKFVVAALKSLIEIHTMDLNRMGQPLDVDWKTYGWANVNRKGDLNVAHTHPGSFWSAIYYVQADERGRDAGGELQFIDPRGTTPITYCPTLRLRMPENYSCGGHELHAPKTGACILFPSWLPHAVMPYKGEGTRVSLAFNFSV